MVTISSSLTDFCIDSESSISAGIDLGTTDLYGVSQELRFLALGDWGQLGCISIDCNVGIMNTMATAMNEYSSAFNPNFVISVGDHFYQNGLESDFDPRWKTSFEDIFSAKNIYWYTILGNHDWYPNKINYNLKKPSISYDDGTQAQISYTTSNWNENKRWCLPYYHYTFAYNFKAINKTIRFIGIDTLLIQYCRDNGQYDTEEYCHGDSIPNVAEFWVWFIEILKAAKSNDEFIAIFTHYSVVSNGNYGLFNPNNEKCTGVTTENIVLRNLTNIMVEYGVDLYIAGHEHNSNLFYGTPNLENLSDETSNYSDDDKYIELLVGSFGKTNGNNCGNYSDIKQQYRNSSIVWNMIYGTTMPGFGAVTINGSHLYTSIIDENKKIKAQYLVEWNDEFEIVNTEYFTTQQQADSVYSSFQFYHVYVLLVFVMNI